MWRGVAGQAWVRNKMVEAVGLPDLKTRPTESDYEVYAERSWLPKGQVLRHRYGARSFIGLPVEVNGNVWGVIVIDSRKDSIGKPKVIRGHYKIVAGLLGKVLEGL